MGFSSENRIFRGRTTVLIVINGLDSSTSVIYIKEDL